MVEIMTSEQREHYEFEANKHADFLCEKVFKPAFIMAFIHGAKHGRQNLTEEILEAAKKKDG